MSDLYMGKYRNGFLVPASRSDVLEWLGWERCDICDGEGRYNLETIDGGTECFCLQGLVPPASQVEAGARAVAGAMYAPPYIDDASRHAARAALIAAMEGVGEPNE